MPLSILLVPANPSRVYRLAEKALAMVGRFDWEDQDGRQQLDIAPHSYAHVPLDWFACGKCSTMIRPSVGDIAPRRPRGSDPVRLSPSPVRQGRRAFGGIG